MGYSDEPQCEGDHKGLGDQVRVFRSRYSGHGVQVSGEVACLS